MMTLKKLITLGVACTALISCSIIRPGTPQKKNPPETGYSHTQQASFYYTEGIKNTIMNGNPETSISLFKKVLEIDSTHAPSLFELATLTVDEPETALQYSLKAQALDTTNIWYQTQLGRLLLTTGRYDSARVVYNNLLRHDPNNPDNYRLIALLHDQKGEPERALALLDSVENQQGVNEMLAALKRQLLIKTQQYDRALKETEALVQNTPGNDNNLVALAELYAMFKKDSLAQATYQRALAIDPNNMRTIASLNNFYKQNNNQLAFLATTAQLFRSTDFPLEPKLKFFEDLIASPNYYRDYYVQLGGVVSALSITYPNDFRTMELYAKHLIAGGSLEEALKVYKTHLCDTLHQRDIFDQVIDIEAYLKRPDSVKKYITLALERFPADAELYLRRGSISTFLLNQPEAARADYHEALKFAQTDSLRSVIYGILGDSYQAEEDFKNSSKAYEKGLKLDTTNAVIYNNYGYFLSLRKERLEKALEMAQHAIRLDPNNPTYLDTYAWVLYQLGRYEEARIPLRQAISLDRTKNKELFLHYGDLLYQLNDHFMASYYWKQAQENGYDPLEIEKRLQQINPK